MSNYANPTGDGGEPLGNEPGSLAVSWTVVEKVAANPFTCALVFEDASGEVLTFDLDPLSVRDLASALATVRDAQAAALGIPHRSATTSHDPDPSAGVGVPDPAPDRSDAAPSVIAAEVTPPITWGTWAATHKLLMFLLVFAVVFGTYGFIGSLRV